MTSSDSTPRPNRPTLVARTPVDLIAMVPFVLGFHPEDSVVLLTFGIKGGPSRGDSFHARVDLPLDPDDQVRLATELRRVMRRNKMECGAVLIYSSDVAASKAQAQACLRALVSRDISLIDIVRVDDGRYFSAADGDAVGTPYDISAHPFTAQHVFEGHVALSSREAVADSLVGTDQEALDRVRAALHSLGPIEAEAEEASWVWERARSHGLGEEPWSDRDVARLVRDIRQIELRDVVWASLTRDRARAMVELLRDVVRRCPHGMAAAPAGLLGFAAWLAGDGALSWCAVERSLEVDPDYAMAHLIADTLMAAIPPHTWGGIDASALPALSLKFLGEAS